jgi:beta-lactamase class D
MGKIILFICGFILSINTIFPSQCFIAKDNNDTVLHQEGDCDKRYAPCSTFKIVLSLIGFDSGILIDEVRPAWPFKKGYVDWRDVWRKNQTPQSWMTNSCVWYSQVLTKKLGMRKFQKYVKKFNYGNMDLSGDKGKHNGLTNSWLSSSLEISSLEQIVFLEKFLQGTLPVNNNAYSMTKNILFIEELKNGWKLYGKTGSGVLLSQDRTRKLKVQHGWFIGWIEKDDKRIIFSNHITDSKEEDTFASLRAKQNAKERLIQIIDQI